VAGAAQYSPYENIRLYARYRRRKSLHRDESNVADTIVMNDFHIALLWLRSLEILIGHSPVLMMSELDFNDLFVRYRSPYKA
jgi:hypothetical protein